MRSCARAAAEHPTSACLIPACPASSDIIAKCTRQTSLAPAQTAVRKSGPCMEEEEERWWGGGATDAVCLHAILSASGPALLGLTSLSLSLSLSHTHTNPHTPTHAQCKKLRDRCLFTCVKEHMCIWTRVVHKHGDR